jgi:hypothetical protein
MGCTSKEAKLLTISGYIAVPSAGVLIDRFYGGQLLRPDGRTRLELAPDVVAGLLSHSPLSGNPYPVFEVQSSAELRRVVARIASKSRERVVFRGQTQHYALSRPVPNHGLHHPHLGETSLIPSVWRRVLARTPTCLSDFVPWTLFEWSAVLYRMFDVDAIDAAILASGMDPALMSTTDMADHPDPRVAAFGEYRWALNVDYDINLATALATLLQHYGLHSPVLDVTSNVDIALFFATHSLRGHGSECAYVPVGSNNDSSIVYLLRYHPVEMEPIKRDLVIDLAKPLRPVRQDCIVVKSSPWAVNLPADFIIAAVKLHGDGPWDVPQSVHDLFPDASDDTLLRLLKTHPHARERVSDFGRLTL